MQDLDQLSKLMPNLYMIYKDIKSNYIDCNNRMIELYSLKGGRLAAHGMTDYEIPCKARELAYKFQQEDQLIIEKKVRNNF